MTDYKVEIQTKKIEPKIEQLGEKLIEKQNKDRLKLDGLIERKDSAKSFIGYLKGCLAIARNTKNLELASLFEDLIKKHNEFQQIEKQDVIKLEIKDGWKGKDDIAIWQGFDANFLIEIHQKDKETNEVTTTTLTIPRENVNKLLFYIKKWQIGEKHKCYDFPPVIGFENWKSLWKERKIYFSSYYYPLKILEELKIIKYGGRGTITRIK